MRILMCNTFYYLRGGSERCVFELTALLESHGHEVIPFAMHDERNRPTPYAKYFVDHIDFPALLQEGKGIAPKFKVAERTIYSREAKRKMAALIEATKPDIAHVHGIAHEISPSILSALHAAKIPIVQTLHDYKISLSEYQFHFSRTNLWKLARGIVTTMLYVDDASGIRWPQVFSPAWRPIHITYFSSTKKM